MSRRSRLALFASGIFFGGGLDHTIYLLTGSPTSHYGLRVGIIGQAVFAGLDFGLATLLYRLHSQWLPVRPGSLG